MSMRDWVPGESFTYNIEVRIVSLVAAQSPKYVYVKTRFLPVPPGSQCVVILSGIPNVLPSNCYTQADIRCTKMESKTEL